MKLISVNIAGHKFIDRVIPFLASAAADVICLQEIFERDFNVLKEKLSMSGDFAAMTLIAETSQTLTGGVGILGIGVLTRIQARDAQKLYYYGNGEVIPVKADNQKDINRVLLYTALSRGAEKFAVGTTHFTWTPDGEADDRQRKDFKKFLEILDTIPEVVLCGDFNAPRGREIFSALAKRFKDNIPQEYETSLDGDLHYAGPQLKVMVDGLFTTPEYRAENVELVGGISDHCAIVANIYRA